MPLLAPLYADAESELPRDVIDELLLRARKHNSDTRRKRQADRLAILRSKHHDCITNQVMTIYGTAEIKKQVEKHVRTTVNPAADIIDNVCAVWRHGGVRRVMGASEKAQEATHKLVRETRFDARAPRWNQVAYFVGPMLLIPKMRAGRLAIDAVDPPDFEVILDAFDPMGQPVGAAVQLADPTDAGSGAAVMVIGPVWRRFFKMDRPTSQWTEIEAMREDNGLGRFPATVLRFEDPQSDDWYVSDRHTRLEEGAADVGQTYAAMRFVRKSQNKRLLSVIGNVESISKGTNTTEPEKPIQVRPSVAANKLDTQIETHDFNTDPIAFFREMRFATESMAESTGVRATVAVDLDRIGVELDHDQLTEVRLRMIEWGRDAETDFWSIAIPTARAGQHRLAADLPDGDFVDDFQVEYPPLARRFADPKTEMEWWDWMFKHGLASVIDLARRQLPASDKQLWARIKKNIEESGVLWRLMEEHNASPDAFGKARTLPQINGAKGPIARDSNPAGVAGQEVGQQ